MSRIYTKSKIEEEKKNEKEKKYIVHLNSEQCFLSLHLSNKLYLYFHKNYGTNHIIIQLVTI